MAELNYVHYYYEDDSYEGGDTEETESAGNGADNEKEPEEKPEIRMRQTEARSGSLINIILISVLAALLLSTVIYSLDKRNTMYNKVSSKNQELSMTEAENVRLRSELESRVSAKNVEDYAKNELGMLKIDSSQIKYIKIQTGDVVNIPEQEETVWTKVKGFFESCVEYFRG